MTDLSHNSRSFSSGGADIELSGSNRTFSPNSELLGITSSPLHSQRTGSEEQSDGHIDNFLIGGESTVNGASFNFVNSIVGAGIIAIPLAIQECGVVLGVFLLLLVAFLVNRSVLILINCGLETNKFDYEELAEHLLGKRGYYITLIFMFLFAYGAQIAYLVIIGDTIPKAAQLLLPGSILCSRQNTLLLFSSLVVLPLCLFRQLSTLSWTSFLSIVAVIVIIVIVFVACVSDKNGQDQHFEVSDTSEVKDSLFSGVGTMSFAFVCQHNSFIVFRSLAKPTYQEWRKVAHLSVSFACFVSVAFGLIGFFTFYPYVDGDLLNNFSVNNYAIATARLFLAVTMIFTYPMEIFVSRHCVVAFARKYMEVSGAATGTAREADAGQEVEEAGMVTPLEGTDASSILASRGRLGGKQPLASQLAPEGRSSAEHLNTQRDSVASVAAPFPEQVGLPVHVLLTVAIWASTLCIALVFSQLGVVSALTGAVAASVLGYILPAVLYLKTYETELHTAYARSLALYHHGHGDSNATAGGAGESSDNGDQADKGVAPAGVEAAAGVLYGIKRYISMIDAFQQFYLSFGLIVFGVLSLFIGVTTVLINAA